MPGFFFLYLFPLACFYLPYTCTASGLISREIETNTLVGGDILPETRES
jgi:hypothetical protein